MVVSGGDKLIYHSESERSVLYDLSEDSLERNDVAGAKPSLAARLQEAVHAWSASYPSTFEEVRSSAPPDAETSEDVLEQLRALGYVH